MKYLLLLLLLAGCESPTKPFIVIDKGEFYGEYWYRYVGKNGVTVHFTDSKNKYQIGDTIK